MNAWHRIASRLDGHRALEHNLRLGQRRRSDTNADRQRLASKDGHLVDAAFVEHGSECGPFLYRSRE